MADAPTPRAKALRDEIFGSALTLDEASYILSLDRTTVAKYLRENAIVGFQIGREWLIPEDELRAYVRRMTDERRAQAQRPAEPPPSDPEGAGFFDHLVRGDIFMVRKRRSKHESGSRFDKFTERAREVLSLAQSEAVRLRHNYIGTEHLLLGLIAEGHGVAAHTLANLGVERDRVRAAVESIVGLGDRAVQGEVRMTPRSKKVVELAVDEARLLGHHYIGTEHLLLGLVREGSGIAGGVLESLGLSLDQVRAETRRILEQKGQPGRDAEDRPLPLEVPKEAGSLLTPDQPGLSCAACRARSPHYFRYCFNCGAALPGTSA